jgi:curved DNA-binding protein CbpA
MPFENQNPNNKQEQQKTQETKDERLHTDPKKLYEKLGLKPGASPAEVKSTYRRLVKENHPDVAAKDEASQQAAKEKMIELNEIYETLGDEEEKQRYDEWGYADGERVREAWRQAEEEVARRQAAEEEARREEILREQMRRTQAEREGNQTSSSSAEQVKNQPKPTPEKKEKAKDDLWEKTKKIAMRAVLVGVAAYGATMGATEIFTGPGGVQSKDATIERTFTSLRPEGGNINLDQLDKIRSALENSNFDVDGDGTADEVGTFNTDGFEFNGKVKEKEVENVKKFVKNVDPTIQWQEEATPVTKTEGQTHTTRFNKEGFKKQWSETAAAIGSLGYITTEMIRSFARLKKEKK